MKRRHRQFHRWAWLFITPAAALAIVLALGWRVAEPANSALPALLLTPAAKG